MNLPFLASHVGGVTKSTRRVSAKSVPEGMPLLLAPLAAAIVGLVFGLLGRDEIRRTSLAPTSTRGFLIVSVLAYGLLAPALGYFVTFYTDWSYTYLIAGERIPSAADLIAIVGSVTLAPLMFVWVAITLRRHALQALVRGAVVVIVATAIVLVLVAPRLPVVGSTAAMRDGLVLLPMSESSLGPSLLWIDGWLLLALFWGGSHLRKIGRA